MSWSKIHDVPELWENLYQRKYIQRSNGESKNNVLPVAYYSRFILEHNEG